MSVPPPPGQMPPNAGGPWPPHGGGPGYPGPGYPGVPGGPQNMSGQMPYGPPPPRPAGIQGQFPGMQATFWQRAGGYLLDGLFMNVAIGAVLMVLALVFAFVMFGARSPGTAVGGIFLLYFAFLAIALAGQVLYEMLAGRRRGQTYGKHIVRTVVVDARTGQPNIGVGRAAVRFLARWVSGAIIIGYLWMLWDPNQRTLHDIMTSTTVVEGPAERILGPIAYFKSLNDPPGTYPQT